MKRGLQTGRGALAVWIALAVVAVVALTAPVGAAAMAAAAVEVPRQEWGLPLTLPELGALVVVVVPLVMGITQAAKRIGVTGKGSFILALGVGLVIGGLVVAAALDVLPDWAGIAIVIVLGGLLTGLAATGIYDLQNKNVKANRALAKRLEPFGPPPAVFEGLDAAITTAKPAGDEAFLDVPLRGA